MYICIYLKKEEKKANDIDIRTRTQTRTHLRKSFRAEYICVCYFSLRRIILSAISLAGYKIKRRERERYRRNFARQDFDQGSN